MLFLWKEAAACPLDLSFRLTFAITIDIVETREVLILENHTALQNISC